MDCSEIKTDLTADNVRRKIIEDIFDELSNDSSKTKTVSTFVDCPPGFSTIVKTELERRGFIVLHGERNGRLTVNVFKEEDKKDQ